MAAYAETIGEVAKEEETRSDSEQVSKPARGPARTPGSYRDVEERTGIPQPTIRAAESRVSTADAFPFMQSWREIAVNSFRSFLYLLARLMGDVNAVQKGKVGRLVRD
jgi:hypothetical protein